MKGLTIFFLTETLEEDGETGAAGDGVDVEIKVCLTGEVGGCC